MMTTAEEQKTPDVADQPTPSADGKSTAEKSTAETSTAEKSTDDAHEAPSRRGATIRVRTLATAVVVLVLAIAAIAATWIAVEKSDTVDKAGRRAASDARAEQVALDYAVGAARMDYKDLATWRARLTKGTSPDLTNRLNKAAESMEQIITPLQWTSTATPILAKVRSDDNGKYTVDSFVNVTTKNTQTPDGVDSTATYSVTLDSTNNWAVTDVGGTGAAVRPGGN